MGEREKIEEGLGARRGDMSFVNVSPSGKRALGQAFTWRANLLPQSLSANDR